MANVELHSDVHHHDRTAPTVEPVGGTIETITSAGAAVLAILALAGVITPWLTAIAVIAAGAAVLFEASAVSRRAHAQGVEKAAGVGADTLAGVTGIVLGILSIIGLLPLILGPIAAIVLGGGLLLSARAPGVGHEERYGEERHFFSGASSVHVLVGAGAIVLGILGVIGLAPGTLTAVAMLAIGAGLLLTETSFGGHLTHMFRHSHT